MDCDCCQNFYVVSLLRVGFWMGIVMVNGYII